MRVAVQKLDGVQSVQVSLERKAADLRLGPGNRVTLTELRQIVKNNGFTAKEATVTVVGTLVERGGRPAIDVTGLGTVWLVTADPDKPDVFREVARRTSLKHDGQVALVGIVQPPVGASEPEQIAVQWIGRPGEVERD